MTAQATELLLLDERYEWLRSLPLQGYLDERQIDMNKFADAWTTGLYRGYQAVWEIADERLYLIGLLKECGRPFDPGIVFPGRSLPIAADWFSGRLEIGQGEALSYFHMGWGHEYSTLLRLYLRQGQVVARRRYDQTRLLRRHFDRFVDENPDWHDILLEQARATVQPLGGLTAAGLKALGRPELEDESILSIWHAGPSSEETAEIADHLLRHCQRPRSDSVSAVSSSPAVPN